MCGPSNEVAYDESGTTLIGVSDFHGDSQDNGDGFGVSDEANEQDTVTQAVEPVRVFGRTGSQNIIVRVAGVNHYFTLGTSGSNTVSAEDLVDVNGYAELSAVQDDDQDYDDEDDQDEEPTGTFEEQLKTRGESILTDAGIDVGSELANDVARIAQVVYEHAGLTVKLYANAQGEGSRLRDFSDSPATVASIAVNLAAEKLDIQANSPRQEEQADPMERLAALLGIA